MRIDAHQHFWVYDQGEYAWIDDSMASLRSDFLPNDLKIELESKGFQGSVAVQARQTLEETRWLLELATDASFILGVVGWVDLRSSNVRSQLEAFAGNPKLVGIRHIVQSEPNDRFLLQPEFLRGISLLEEFDLAYDLLIYPKHLPVAAEFVRRFPRQRFVLDHLAKPPIKSGSLRPWERGMRELGTLPNVFCKLSGLVTEADWRNWKPEHIAPYMDVAFETFGPRRLMIGSDWPVCTLAASYTRAIDLVESYLSQHPTEVQEAALGGNAQQFWKLGTRQKQLPGDSQHTVGNGKNKREGDAAHASRRGCARNEK
ncbi:MAG TPA: amidohydrolase family protein [Candidatus Limnocylindria bacterium]|jgi:L-fuconolactonase|nr:amidohydrolase family protein [Candidatus Limnocylindria bacterium]